MLTRLRGCWAALPTPFRNQMFDEAAFEALLEWHIAQGTSVCIVGGETGEASTLTESEQTSLFSRAVEISHGRLSIVAAVVSNATDKAIRILEAVQDAGAEAALVTVPYYNKPTQAGILEHFRRLVASTSVPLILHNPQEPSSTTLSAAGVVTLANQGVIEGVVDPFSDRVLTLDLPDRILAIAGSDMTGPTHTLLGGDGWLSVGAAVAPRIFQDLYSACHDGDVPEVRRLCDATQPLVRALNREPTPSTCKHALRLRLNLSEEVRLPLIEVSGTGAEAIGRALDATN